MRSGTSGRATAPATSSAAATSCQPGPRARPGPGGRERPPSRPGKIGRHGRSRPQKTRCRGRVTRRRQCVAPGERRDFTSNPVRIPRGRRWRVSTCASRRRHAADKRYCPSCTSTLNGEARRRGNAGTQASSQMHASKPRWTSLLREQVSAQSTEPPDTDPYVRWCGRGGAARLPPIPVSVEGGLNSPYRPYRPCQSLYVSGDPFAEELNAFSELVAVTEGFPSVDHWDPDKPIQRCLSRLGQHEPNLAAPFRRDIADTRFETRAGAAWRDRSQRSTPRVRLDG